MEILFIGVACTDEAIKDSNKKYYSNKSTVRPQQYFDLNLVKGLSENCNVKALSEPPVASFPKSSCIWYNRKDDVLSDTLKIKYISLLNIFIIKTIIISFTILFETVLFSLKHYKNHDKCIVTGYLSSYTSIPVILISKLMKVKCYVVVPDIPQYILGYNGKRNKLFDTFTIFSNHMLKLVERRFNGYILLTKYMNDLVNPNHKPYIVMEGFFNSEDISPRTVNLDLQNKIVMYAGTLHKKFGIEKLVEAFKLLHNKDYELWIFGEGDFESEIRQIEQEYENIHFNGVRDREEILHLEKEVTLLVNPRPTIEDFTKFSFPSKTLEYMASGTPLLTTKLKGIPEEYYDYIYTFEGEDINDLSKKINEILELPSEVLSRKGVAAKTFVLEKKSNITQSKRIYDFIMLNLYKKN